MTVKEWQQIFTARVKERMEAQGISQRELADRAGLTECSISHYLNGKRVPRIDNIVAIAKALKTTPGTLIDVGELIDVRGLKE